LRDSVAPDVESREIGIIAMLLRLVLMAEAYFFYSPLNEMSIFERSVGLVPLPKLISTCFLLKSSSKFIFKTLLDFSYV
jgi:hypothetical protein